MDDWSYDMLRKSGGGSACPNTSVKYSGTKGMLNVEWILQIWTSLRHARLYQQDASNLPAVRLQWRWRGIPLTAQDGTIQVQAHVFVPCLVCLALLTKQIVCFLRLSFLVIETNVRCDYAIGPLKFILCNLQPRRILFCNVSNLLHLQCFVVFSGMCALLFL